MNGLRLSMLISFRMYGCISSGPGLLLFFNCLIAILNSLFRTGEQSLFLSNMQSFLSSLNISMMKFSSSHVHWNNYISLTDLQPSLFRLFLYFLLLSVMSLFFFCSIRVAFSVFVIFVSISFMLSQVLFMSCFVVSCEWYTFDLGLYLDLTGLY